MCSKITTSHKDSSKIATSHKSNLFSEEIRSSNQVQLSVYKTLYSTSPEVQTDAKPRVVKNQRTPNKAGSGSLSMERAPERSPNHPSVASVAGRRRRSAQSARAAGPRRWVGPLFVADVAPRGPGRPAQPRAAHLFLPRALDALGPPPRQGNHNCCA